MRPGLERLRDAALAGAFEVLLCLSPDRLARNRSAEFMAKPGSAVCGLGGVAATADRGGLSEPTAVEQRPQAQLLFNIQGAFAEYERVLISERMRRGRLYRLRQGWSAPHQAPYGYRYRPATRERSNGWEIVPEQAAVVEQMFLWYTEAGLILEQIAQQLNQDRVPGPEGRGWTGSTVGRMLRQSVYKGTVYYNRYQDDESSLGQLPKIERGRLRVARRISRPVEEWIAIPVPAIVGEALWQAAQERLGMQECFSRRNSRRLYLLRGLLVCGVCGHTLQGRTDARE